MAFGPKGAEAKVQNSGIRTQAIIDDPTELIYRHRTDGTPTLRIETPHSHRELAQHYHALISKMCDGFALLEIICNETGRPCDCRFLEVNPTFEKITGLNAQALIGKTVQEVLPGTESFWVYQCGRVALTGRLIQFKNDFKMFKRHFEVIAYRPQKGQVATVFTDITERVRMEAALQESENNFRAISENAKDGILIEVCKDAHAFANRCISDISGYSIAILRKIGFMNLVHPDEIDKVLQRYKRMLEGRPVPPCYETIIVRKDGAHVPVEVASSITIWQGRPAVLRIVRDITLRKHLEAALGKEHNALELSVKKRARELIYLGEELGLNQKELLRNKVDLEKTSKELAQTHTALSVLARNIDRKRDDVENKIAHAISSKIMPIVEELHKDQIPEKSRAKLDVLGAYLKDLSPGFTKGHDIIVSLSSMELRVAMMIKNGFASEDIARILHISPLTVKTHRKSIRKKLKIQNSNINLASYLKLKMGEEPRQP